jgi:hypothetical protein
VISYKNINFLLGPIDGLGWNDKIWGDQFIEVLMYTKNPLTFNPTWVVLPLYILTPWATI